MDDASAVAGTRPDLEQLLVANLGLIRRIAGHVARRLPPQDIEDFTSDVVASLVDNDYRILARFQNRSTVATYLYKVIHRMYVDRQVALWGRWRASAEAQRLGDVAIRLEVLLVRDGLTLDEAVEVLRTNHRVSLSDEEIRALSLRLPPRLPPRSFVGREVLAELAQACANGDGQVLRREAEPVARAVEAALRRLVAALLPQDRIILRLHCEEGFSWTDVARFLGVPSRALYDRKDKLLKGMQAELRRGGIHADVLELLRDGDWDILVALE